MNSLLDQLSNDLDPGDSSALRQLLTHVPDVVINCDHKKSMPRVKHMVGVCMFADISGELKDPVQFENGGLFLYLKTAVLNHPGCIHLIAFVDLVRDRKGQ